MKVSVVIPVYNVQHYLEACLESVLCQALDDFEVICVNDRSTDNSIAILEKYASMDGRIRVICHEKNRGLSEARNTGIEAASGKYLYFLDSDDMLAKDALESMYEYSEREGLDVLYFDGVTVYESPELEIERGQYKYAYQREISYGVFEHGWELFAKFIDGDDYYVQSSLQFVKREYLESIQLKYYPGLLYEDTLFNLQCILQAGRTAHINQRFFYRRIRGGSIMTSKKDMKCLLSAYIIYKEMCKFIEQMDQSIEKRIAGELVVVLDSALDMVKFIYYYQIDWRQREKLEGLETVAQYEIPRLVSEKDEVEYPFPYYLLHRDSRVVIYGAGKIGKSYYKQLSSSSYANIAGWIDKNYVNLNTQGYFVEPVSALKDMEYDNVFIAIADKNAAFAAMQELAELGIDQKCMIWNGVDYVRYVKEQQALLNAEYRLCQQAWKSDQPKCWLFMTPEHGNMGDYALAFAQQKYLLENFPQYTYIDVATEDWKKYQKVYKSAVQERDILFLSGGGFIGDMWQSGKTIKNIIESFPNHKKIALPNTLTFVNNDRNVIKEEAKFYSRQENLLLFSRDRNSYEIMREEHYREADELGCYPDMALLFNFCRENPERKDVLLCLRADCEKKTAESIEDYLIKLLEELRFSYRRLEMHLKKTIKKDNARRVLMDKIGEFYSARLVITDRLHGMVFAAITGTPCIAMDNSTGKVSGVYQWIRHLPYVCCVDEEAIDGALIQKMAAYGNGKYDNAEIVNQISRMTDQIKEWWKGQMPDEHRTICAP